MCTKNPHLSPLLLFSYSWILRQVNTVKSISLRSLTSVWLVLFFASSYGNFVDHSRPHSGHSPSYGKHASFHQPHAHPWNRGDRGDGSLGKVQALSSDPSHTIERGSNSSLGGPIQAPRKSTQHARLRLRVVLVVVWFQKERGEKKTNKLSFTDQPRKQRSTPVATKTSWQQRGRCDPISWRFAGLLSFLHLL